MDEYLDTCHDLIGEGEPKESVVDELVDDGLDEALAEEMYDEEYAVVEDDLSEYLQSEGLLESIFNKTIIDAGFSAPYRRSSKRPRR